MIKNIVTWLLYAMILLGFATFAFTQNSVITLDSPNNTKRSTTGVANFTAAFGIGKYTDAQEDTLVSSLTSANAGTLWYNTEHNGIMLWNGTRRIDVQGVDFGDASSGDATITGTTTLTSDAYYRNLTVSSTGVLVARGVRIFVDDKLTIQAGGVIHADGNNGLNATSNVGATGGASVTTIFIGGSNAGGTGGKGSTGAGVQAARVTNVANCGGTAGAGGAGGKGSGRTGGASRLGERTLSQIRYFTYQFDVGGITLLGGASAPGGSSAGGGAGGQGGGGGGGGSGGGIVAIFAENFENNGIIRSNGGNGGNGFSPASGNAGGGRGGGGGGGCIYLISDSFINIGTTQVNGGTGGNGGSPSGTGTAGSNGTNGGSGSVFIFNATEKRWL